LVGTWSNHPNRISELVDRLSQRLVLSGDGWREIQPREDGAAGFGESGGGRFMPGAM
jgi:hypothetical protein